MIPTRLFPPPEPASAGDRPVLVRALRRLFHPRESRRTPEDPRLRSRHRIRDLNRVLEVLTQTIRALEQEIARLQEDLRDLERRFQDFVAHRGRYAVVAFGTLLCVPLSVLLDLAVLAKPIEALGFLMGFPAGLPVQLAGSAAVTGILYLAGIKFAIARRAREPVWGPLLVGALLAGAVSILAFEQARTAGLEGRVPQAFGYLGLAGPVFAFLAGAGLPETTDYLHFLRRHRQLRRSLRELQRRRDRLGGRFMNLYMRMVQAQEDHRERFGEQLLPQLSPAAQRLFREFAETTPGPQQFQLEIVEDPQAQGPESRPPDGRDEGPTVVVDGEDEASHAYLMRQLERRSLREDAELPPTS